MAVLFVCFYCLRCFRGLALSGLLFTWKVCWFSVTLVLVVVLIVLFLLLVGLLI